MEKKINRAIIIILLFLCILTYISRSQRETNYERVKARAMIVVDSLNNSNEVLRDSLNIYEDSISGIIVRITDKEQRITKLKNELFILNKENEEIDSIIFDDNESWDIFSRFTDL